MAARAESPDDSTAIPTRSAWARKRAIVEPAEFVNAFAKIGATRKRPERSEILQRQAAKFCFVGKLGDFRFGSAREEKQLVKIAHADVFGFAGREAGVLAEFARSEAAQRHDGSLKLRRKILQGVCSGGLRFRNRECR